MSDQFLDDYYLESKKRLELAKKAYKLVHSSVGGAIESQFLAKFDLKDPRRSKATLQAASGIRGHFERFEDRLLKTDQTVALAAIQRDLFVTHTGLNRANTAFDAQRNASLAAVDPLDHVRQALDDFARLREGLKAAIVEMDAAKRKANLQVGALSGAIATALFGRVELIVAFANTELPVTAWQALKALRDVSAEKATEQIGEALVEAVKAVAPEIAEQLLQIASIVRTYQAVAEAFGAHDVDSAPNAVEALQNLWEAMEAEEEVFSAIEASAATVARQLLAT